MTVVALFGDDAFQYAFELALGAAYRQAADIGEVLCTAERICDGDVNSWVDEWSQTAGSALAAAREALRGGRRVSALTHQRRAATYYATALTRVAQCEDPSRAKQLWQRQRECWEQIIDLSSPAGERLAIPYEQTTLPAWFFRAPEATADERRALVIINNGANAATSQMWVHGGAAAAERGYHWMTFDGPGQQSMLVERGLPSRPDWEAVLTPVIDCMLARGDVDPARVAAIGVGHGGYWVPRALAFEHRLAAAAVDPGVVDLSSALLESLGEPLRTQLRAGRRDAFDREMHLFTLLSPHTAAGLRSDATPFAGTGRSAFETYTAVGKYVLGDLTRSIDTPLLITEPDGERFWPGQSRQLYDRLAGSKRLVRFGVATGADRDCESLATAMRDTRIFDWLDRYLGVGETAA